LFGFFAHIFPMHSLRRRLSKSPVLRVTQLATVIGCDDIVEGSRYIWFGILLSDGRVL